MLKKKYTVAENLKVNNYHAIPMGVRKRGKIIYTKQLILEFLDTIQCHVYCFVIKLFIARDKTKTN